MAEVLRFLLIGRKNIKTSSGDKMHLISYLPYKHWIYAKTKKWQRSIVQLLALNAWFLLTAVLKRPNLFITGNQGAYRIETVLPNHLETFSRKTSLCIWSMKYALFYDIPGDIHNRPQPSEQHLNLPGQSLSPLHSSKHSPGPTGLGHLPGFLFCITVKK